VKKERFIVACNCSVSTINAVREMVLSVWEDCRIEIGQDPDCITVCDVFICNPFLFSGFDFDKPLQVGSMSHFERAFFVFWNHSCGVESNTQLINRYHSHIATSCFIDARLYINKKQIHDDGISELESILCAAVRDGDKERESQCRDAIALLSDITPDKVDDKILRQSIEEGKERNNFIENTLGFLRDKYSDMQIIVDTGK